MCRNRAVASVVLLAALTVGRAARAEVIEGNISTVLSGRSDPRDGVVYTVVPVYQLLNLSLRDVKVPGGDKYLADLRLEVSGWLGGLLGEPIGGQRFLGDLNLAYVEGKLFRRKVEVRLGRQMITGGVARFTHLDGASLRFNIWRGLSLTAFGGVPVIQRFGVKVGDATIGARLAYRTSHNTELGASFIHLHDKGRTARQDFGLDGRMLPHPNVSLSYLLVISILEKQLAEADIGATFTPRRWLTARVDYRHDVPNLWIPRSSIFSVFSDTTRDEVGGELEFRWPRALQVRADYHVVVEEAGTGHRGGMRLSITPGTPGRSQIGIEGRLLKREGPGYFEGRVFGYHRIVPNLLISVDVDTYKFDRHINGRDFSVTGTAALAWDFARHFRAVASAAVNASPYVDNGYDFMIKLAYMPVARFRETR